MDYQQKNYGGLTVLEVPAKQADAPCVVLFHGYGANAQDLVSLSQVLDKERQLHWYYPNGPLDVYFSPEYVGSAWFPVDLDLIQLARFRGEESGFSGHTPQGLQEARQAAQAALDAMGIPMSRTILGGFSQGAMMATELTLTSPTPPAGLIILSGTLVDKDRWTLLAAKRPGIPFIQTHGKSDPLLDVYEAARLTQLLQSSKMPGQLHTFEGGHEIPPHLIPLLKEFISTTLPSI